MFPVISFLLRLYIVSTFDSKLWSAGWSCPAQKTTVISMAWWCATAWGDYSKSHNYNCVLCLPPLHSFVHPFKKKKKKKREALLLSFSTLPFALCGFGKHRKKPRSIDDGGNLSSRQRVSELRGSLLRQFVVKVYKTGAVRTVQWTAAKCKEPGKCGWDWDSRWRQVSG